MQGSLTQWIYCKTTDSFQMTLRRLIRFQMPAFPHPLYRKANNEWRTPKATVFCKQHRRCNYCSHLEGQKSELSVEMRSNNLNEKATCRPAGNAKTQITLYLLLVKHVHRGNGFSPVFAEFLLFKPCLITSSGLKMKLKLIQCAYLAKEK